MLESDLTVLQVQLATDVAKVKIGLQVQFGLEVSLQ